MIKENVYGHLKKLEFIKKSIAEFQKEAGRKPLILDVGCGTGVMITTPLAEARHKIIGLDTSEESIALAQKHNHLPNCQFMHGFLEDQSDLKNFDIIICSEVLEHLHEPEKLVKTMKSKLKPEGIMIITVPNGYGWFEFEQLVAKIIFFDQLLKIKDKLTILFYKTAKTAYSQFFSRFRYFRNKYSSYQKKKPPIPAAKETIAQNSFDSSPHVQHFTIKKFKGLMEKNGLKITKIGKSSFFAGRISNTLFENRPKFIRWNLTTSERLPLIFSTSWYFLVKNKLIK